MLNRFFGAKFHSNFHVFVLLLLLVGVCCSTFLMSMGLFLGGLNFFLEGNFSEKFNRLKQNKFFLLIFGFYLVHVLAMLWTNNWEYGLNALRQKSSLGIIPIIICSSPLPKKSVMNLLFAGFVTTLVITSLTNFFTYAFFADRLHLIDIRDMSLFGSHIRFGILIGFGVACCYFLAQSFKKLNVLFLLVASWFAFYTYYSQVLSGIIVLMIVLFGLLFWKLYQQKKYVAIGAIAFIAGGLIIAVFIYLMQPIKQEFVFRENYITLEQSWNKRSAIAYDSLDLRKQNLSQTLERYLISKNLPVSGDGVDNLTPIDIDFIEKGFADVRETKSGLIARLFGIRYQLHNASNPNGHSILERIEYWKNAREIIKTNWIFGVGTGDVNDAMQQMYTKRNSSLTEDRRLRAHNSYLTFWMTFGVFGLLYFVFFQAKFFLDQWKKKQVLGVFFIVIAFVTFLFEDTLETQMGITFFTLFYALFSLNTSAHNDATI